MSDEAIAKLNPPPAEVTDEQPGVNRPADSAAKAAWVDHVVSLGADRDAVTGGSKHWDDEARDYVPAASLSKDELMELADRLGG